MTDPAIIEAVKWALQDNPGTAFQTYQELAEIAVAAALPLIRAAALKEAAQVADDAATQEAEACLQLKAEGNEEKAMIYARYTFEARVIAAAIRALKLEESPYVMPLVEARAIERAEQEFEEQLRAVTAERDALKERLDDIDSEARGREW